MIDEMYSNKQNRKKSNWHIGVSGYYGLWIDKKTIWIEILCHPFAENQYGQFVRTKKMMWITCFSGF